MTIINTRESETGAILPIFALLIVVLLMFAAFTVDLGAAWAERRQDQTAVDAAAMGAALQYLHENDAPSPQQTIDLVIDYASRNLTNPPTDTEWQLCTDGGKPDAFYLPMTDDAGFTYDCISLRQESDAPVRLRVRLPDRNVPTSFAQLMGVDTITVFAAAIAEIQFSALAQVLPFSVQSNPSTEECFGVPPNGHNDGDAAPCADGSDSGTYGLLDSPWFGSGTPPHNTSAPCDDSASTFDKRSRLNLALGLDHVIKVWPYDAVALDTDVANENKYQGQDTCSAAENDVPGAMVLQTGTYDNNAAAMTDGLIGTVLDGAGAPTPGRLRRTGGLNTTSSDRLAFNGAELDNVGLWEYLTGGNGNCDFGPTGPGNVGRALTEQLVDCLTNGSPSFVMELTESPRFALVPVLGYTRGLVSGGSAYPIYRMTPVYIQSTWFGCDGSNGPKCLFHPDDFINPALDGSQPQDPTWDDTVPMWYTPVFNPGEGTTTPCQSKKGYDDKKPDDFDCLSPGDIVLKGVSGIVLDWTMFPDDAENAIGSNAPYLVQLYR